MVSSGASSVVRESSFWSRTLSRTTDPWFSSSVASSPSPARSRLGMSMGTYGPVKTCWVRAAARRASTPALATGSVLARCAHISRVSGPGTSVSGTSPERDAASARRLSRPDAPIEARNAGRILPSGVVAGSAVIGQIHETFSGSPSGAPSVAGATAARWVTNSAMRSPLSGSRSSTSTGKTPVRRPVGDREAEAGRVPRGVGVLEPQGEDPPAGRGDRQRVGRGRRAGDRRAEPLAVTVRSNAVRLVMAEWTVARTSSPATGPVIESRNGTSAPRVAYAGCSRRAKRRLVGVAWVSAAPTGPVGAAARPQKHHDGEEHPHPLRVSSHNDRPMTHRPAGSSRKPHDSYSESAPELSRCVLTRAWVAPWRRSQRRPSSTTARP